MSDVSDVTDGCCGGMNAHISWQDRFGPKSGFGMFGRQARRVKGFTLSDEEWAVLVVSSALAFAHWENTGGPGAVTNNLRTLHKICMLNSERATRGGEQKIRMHQLQALVACAEWYVAAWPALEQQEEEGSPAAVGERAEREKIRENARRLLPRLKRVTSEVQ